MFSPWNWYWRLWLDNRIWIIDIGLVEGWPELLSEILLSFSISIVLSIYITAVTVQHKMQVQSTVAVRCETLPDNVAANCFDDLVQHILPPYFTTIVQHLAGTKRNSRTRPARSWDLMACDFSQLGAKQKVFNTKPRALKQLKARIRNVIIKANEWIPTEDGGFQSCSLRWMAPVCLHWIP